MGGCGCKKNKTPQTAQPAPNRVVVTEPKPKTNINEENLIAQKIAQKLREMRK